MKVKTSALSLVAAERARQLNEEGFTLESDKRYQNGELAHAAMAYACPPGEYHRSSSHPWGGNPPIGWPWDHRRWKPGDRVRELTKAAVLIVAEIDRLLAEEGGPQSLFV